MYGNINQITGIDIVNPSEIMVSAGSGEVLVVTVPNIDPATCRVLSVCFKDMSNFTNYQVGMINAVVTAMNEVTIYIWNPDPSNSVVLAADAEITLVIGKFDHFNGQGL